jgi:adenylosuccinate synthase
LLDPLAMVEEAKHLEAIGVVAPFQRTQIDAQAWVITPFQRAVNRLREMSRGEARHGSCGMGIGETMSDALTYGQSVLFAGDLGQPDRCYEKLAFLRRVNLEKLKTIPIQATHPEPYREAMQQELDVLLDPDWLDWLMEAYHGFTRMAQIVPSTALNALLQRPGTVIFEGAQGALLDEWRGFHPYTTWSTTTLANADHLLHEANYTGNVTRIGITRAYTTRHGAGPLVTEEKGLSESLPDAANHFGTWQQGFRVGWLDLVMLRYALEIVGRVDRLAVTCLDRSAALPEVKYCRRYQHQGASLDQLKPSTQARDLDAQAALTQCVMACEPILETVTDCEELLAVMQAELDVPIGILSAGATAREKRMLMG